MELQSFSRDRDLDPARPNFAVVSNDGERESPQPFRPIRSWMVLLGAVAVVVMTSLAWMLLSHASRGVTDVAEAAKLRVEVIRTVLTVGAGTGGAVALLLAVRRQWLNERDQLHREQVAADSQYDAAERRITELYVKAAEQLGSDKAPVRLAGLYALERLAQDNAAHRQTIVEVICAYLRMPYTLPGERDTSSRSDPPQEQSVPTDEKKISSSYDPHEEQQVRLAAQHILARHLRPAAGPDEEQSPDLKFWPDIEIDLSGAFLMSLDFSHCRLLNGVFTAATFTGAARFQRATFNGDARFEGATFSGVAEFWETAFNRYAQFDGATFNGDAWFTAATFKDAAGFGKATFNRAAGFAAATFNRHVWFDKAAFNRYAQFDGATFNDDALFGGATLRGSPVAANGPANGTL